VEISKTESKPIYSCFLEGNDIKGDSEFRIKWYPLFQRYTGSVNLIKKLSVLWPEKDIKKIIDANTFKKEENIQNNQETSQKRLCDYRTRWVTISIMNDSKIDTPNQL
jgi:hypothetical protein